MNPISRTRPLEKFFALQAQPSSQSGVIRLEKGGASSESPDCNVDQDQTVLLIEGELLVEVGNAGQRIAPGTALTVPAGVKHRFVNLGRKPALAFTVFA
jgi:mannose-6-phosphate isomerase-like protein (cupin superfamily)